MSPNGTEPIFRVDRVANLCGHDLGGAAGSSVSTGRNVRESSIQRRIFNSRSGALGVPIWRIGWTAKPIKCTWFVEQLIARRDARLQKKLQEYTGDTDNVRVLRGQLPSLREVLEITFIERLQFTYMKRIMNLDIQR
jgi:hypothetical protein